MRKILTLLMLLCVMGYVSAQTPEAITVRDVTFMETTNYQGDVLVMSGLDSYNWGKQLGYLGVKGYADKPTKVPGTLGLRLVPLNDDGSFCKVNLPCSWEEQKVTIEADDNLYHAYLPAGDSYNTPLYFYVAVGGSTYWAKSGHTEGPNSHIDLSFEKAISGDHLARADPDQFFDEIPAPSPEPDRKLVVEPVNRSQDVPEGSFSIDHNVLLTLFVVIAVIVLLFVTIRRNTKPDVDVSTKKVSVSKRRRVNKKKSLKN
ncbi:hypothetical protein HOD83_02570 [Candidatus Woesearchaeota archaeon]|jgi:hypothetical protein|nr:hypothetical protein [Candidatus Woesearchaeota archaeon]MBT4114307.1 hypothetical protein [Candidatus Woesearchaeota archaeon]MBT4248451.1 hypothetical protein [Candidatus Woesearchaeota archaeon]